MSIPRWRREADGIMPEQIALTVRARGKTFTKIVNFHNATMNGVGYETGKIIQEAQRDIARQLYPEEPVWIKLKNTEWPHYKFWKIRREAHIVYTSYGRIGTEGQLLTKYFSSIYAAEDYMQDKIAEKLRNGYEEV